MVENECRTTMLYHDMYICRLIKYAQQIEESKFKNERKRSRVKNEGSDAHGCSKNRQNSSEKG